jgi:hypothetical protein
MEAGSDSSKLMSQLLIKTDVFLLFERDELAMPIKGSAYERKGR